MQNQKTRNLILSALFMAIGFVLPFVTGQLREFGNLLLPMHIPVMLCGFICGWQYGLAVGFILPIMRSALFGMPMMFPNAIGMAFELATYGFICGYIYNHSKKSGVATIYISLISAMIIGRIVWGISRAVMLVFGNNIFTLGMFVTTGFTSAIPGIVIQLVVIPAVMVLLKKSRIV